MRPQTRYAASAGAVALGARADAGDRAIVTASRRTPRPARTVARIALRRH